MKLLSFLGETPTIALRKAVKVCGDDAVVVSTKKISTASKNSIDMYEVIVSIEEQEEVSTPVKQQQVNRSYEEEKEDLLNLKKSILDMQKTIFQMQNTLWTNNKRNTIEDLAIPVEFSDIYRLFVENDMPKDVTYKIMKHTIERLPAAIKGKPHKVNNFFRLVLRRMLQIKHEVPIESGNQKIMIFVGPTGVGKTTTLAKLAARHMYALKQNLKIGMITLDSFRVGAAEQLKQYAQIMQIPISQLDDPSELPQAIKRLGNPQVVFIDTPGSSQYDKKMINMTKAYYDKNPDLSIETNLILPTNVKSSDLKEIYDEFSTLNIDNIIFTKLDETKSFGNVISFIHEIKKPITYFSIGQEVPDDLIVSDEEFLIDCFFNQGIKKIKKESA